MFEKMKKAAIITILDNTNFGTYLQALALAKQVQQAGCEVEVIDYARPCTSVKYRLAAIKNPLKKLYNAFYGMHKWQQLRQKDHKFLSRFVKFTSHTYHSFQELKMQPPVADIYITGSDQVWNSIYNRGIDKSFYLDFAPQNAKRVAYGASIGMSEIPRKEVKETVELLNKYDAISVRETDAKRILAEIGIENTTMVLDPTLLLNADEWKNIAGRYPEIETEPFILVYSVETDKENSLMGKYASAISKQFGWKIYEVSYFPYRRRLQFADRHFMQATPNIFLQLMIKAKFVVVSSFHGTAFAINFNKQFLTVAPNRFNSRVNNILKLCHLEDRMITSTDFTLDSLSPIDYLPVNHILEKERNRSITILHDMLKIK